MNLSNSNVFTTDYRSLPSGIGTIEMANGDLILVQSLDYTPEVLDDVYKEIIIIQSDFENNFNKTSRMLTNVLKRYNVEYVYDFELIYEIGDQDKDLPAGYMTLDKFDELRKEGSTC
jgi:hypothetical protein